MSIAIEYLYKYIKKFDVNLLAGESGLNNKVRWTHIVENEEIAGFIQAEELLFTTGVSIKDDTTLLNIINIAKDHNASGIVVNTGKYIEKISEEVIDYCNENEFPLFVMPWNIRIPDIMRALTIIILESERTYTEISNAIKDAIFLPTHEELYVQQLERVGFKCGWDYVVAIIELEDDEHNTNNIPTYAEMVKSYIEKKLSYIRNNYFAVNIGKSVAIVFYNKTDLEVEKIMKELYISMNKDFRNLKLFIGIGKRVNNLKLLYKGYEEAKNVAKINRLISNNKVHIRYSEMAIYRLLLEMENKEIIKEFHDQTIGDLVVYDKVNNTDYVELLENYFENNCKINETAKSLYLHRNTVNYKISKIEEILDINLDDIDTVVLSHGHYDHAGGIKDFIESRDDKINIICHPLAFNKKKSGNTNMGAPYTKEEIIKLANVKFSDKPVKMSKNITYLGQIPDTIDFENRKLMGQIEIDGEYKNDYIIDDSALLYETQDGIYIITGCSHSGICNIIEYAKKVSKKDNVLGIIGGTHLQEINNQLYKTIDYFKANNIKELYPCHCTKFYVKAEMFKYLNIKDAHVGLEINW